MQTQTDMQWLVAEQQPQKLDKLMEIATRRGLAGCEKCNYGIVNYYNLQPVPSVPLYVEKLIQYHNGEMNICDCPAGRGKLQWFARMEENYKISKEERETMARISFERKQKSMFDHVNIPEEFQKFEFQTYANLYINDPGKRKAINEISTYYATGSCYSKKPGIMLWGRSDRGKTGVLSPLFRDIVKVDFKGLWIQYNQLLAQLRKFDDGQVDARMVECMKTPVLFIDDLGDPMAEKLSDYTRDVIFRIIDHRCANNLRTFITTNLAPTQISALFHERTLKRIANMCEVIEVGGEAIGSLR